MKAARYCKFLIIMSENSARDETAGVTYWSMRIHSKNCPIFPLKVYVTLLNGLRKGAAGAYYSLS